MEGGEIRTSRAPIIERSLNAGNLYPRYLYLKYAGLSYNSNNGKAKLHAMFYCGLRKRGDISMRRRNFPWRVFSRGNNKINNITTQRGRSRYPVDCSDSERKAIERIRV